MSVFDDIKKLAEPMPDIPEMPKLDDLITRVEPDPEMMEHVRTGVKSLQTELELLRQEATDYHAQEAKRHRDEDFQAKIDRKKDLRHDFIVAAFGAAFALILERIGDIIKFLIQLFHV